MRHIVALAVSVAVACGIAGMAMAHGTAQLEDHLPAAGLTPGNPFYFIDRWWEGVQNFFTFSAKGKAKLQTEFAAERLSEIEVLKEAKGSTAGEALKGAADDYKEHIRRAGELINGEKAKGVEVDDLLHELDDMALEQENVFDSVLEDLDLEISDNDGQEPEASALEDLKEEFEGLEFPARLEGELEL